MKWKKQMLVLAVCAVMLVAISNMSAASTPSMVKENGNNEGEIPTVSEITMHEFLERSGTTQILAWVPYTDHSQEYPNTLSAISEYYTDYTITESYTTDPSILASELVGKDVFLMPEPEMTDSATLAAIGSSFATVLDDFASNGGTVIVCCEWIGREGFLLNAGLMSATYANGYWSDTFTVVAAHPITEGLGPTVEAANAVASYYITDADVQYLIEDSYGCAVVAVRAIDGGHAVCIGYDYFDYNDDAARIIANAVEFGGVSSTPAVSVTTDRSEYCPGNTMIRHLEIDNPTASPVTFNWYLGVPQFTYWSTIASASIQAGFSYSDDLPFPVGDWGSTPFGMVWYVELTDGTGEVLDSDAATCAYSPYMAVSKTSDAVGAIEKSIRKAGQ